MASAKDTFEASTFLSDTFACGVWRGVGPNVFHECFLQDSSGEYILDSHGWRIIGSTCDSELVPGIEYALADTRLHYALADTRLQYALEGDTA